MKYEINNNNNNCGVTMVFGATGSGKTYKILNDAIDSGERFAYISPTRDLTQEVFITYGDHKEDTFHTGGACRNVDKENNLYGVYESIQIKDLKKYRLLIIDECHYLDCDNLRGQKLLKLFRTAFFSNIKIILTTATNNFDKDFIKKYNIKVINLPAWADAPKKIQISKEEFEKKVEAKVSTIYFVKSIEETKLYAHYYKYKYDIITSAISSETLPAEKLKIQMDFNAGKIDMLVSTNILAQGLNFPCENLYISKDAFSIDVTYIQKLGRLGRRGKTISKEVYYYSEVPIPEKINVKKRIVKKKIEEEYKTFAFIYPEGRYKIGKDFIIVNGQSEIIGSSFENFQMFDVYYLSQIYHEFGFVKYANIKYSKRFLMFLSKLPKLRKIDCEMIVFALKKLDENNKQLNEIIDSI